MKLLQSGFSRANVDEDAQQIIREVRITGWEVQRAKSFCAADRGTAMYFMVLKTALFSGRYVAAVRLALPSRRSRLNGVKRY